MIRARDQMVRGPAEAMERLCRADWFPLYAFLRRQGCPPDDAQDAGRRLRVISANPAPLATARPASN